MKENGTENRNVCGNSGKIVRTGKYVSDGIIRTLILDPAKKGGYSYQFECSLCGKSTDAHLTKRDGEFHVTSHIVKRGYLSLFDPAHVQENFRTMGKREKKSDVPVSDVSNG